MGAPKWEEGKAEGNWAAMAERRVRCWMVWEGWGWKEEEEGVERREEDEEEREEEEETEEAVDSRTEGLAVGAGVEGGYAGADEGE